MYVRRYKVSWGLIVTYKCKRNMANIVDSLLLILTTLNYELKKIVAYTLSCLEIANQ